MSRTFITSDGVSADALQKNPNFLLDNYILEGKTIPIHLFGDNIATAIDDAITYLTNVGGGRVHIPANGTNFELEIRVFKDRNGTYHTNFEYNYDRYPTVEGRPYTNGAWQVGDTIFNSQPNIDKCVGWVCTAAGTPGTWTPFGWTKKFFSEIEIVDSLPDPNELQEGRQLLCRESNGSTILYYCINDNDTYKWERSINLPIVDKTLTQSGSAADSKVVDDRINEEAAARINSDSNLSQEIAVERARINQFTALEEGSTTGDAELIDIRVGVNGTLYPTAGEAVRGQVTQLKGDIDDIRDAIGPPLTVDSVNEMTNTNKQYVLNSTGTIWVYKSATTEQEVTVTDQIEGVEENPYYDNSRLPSSGTAATSANGSFISPFIYLDKSEYQGKEITIHLDGATYLTETNTLYVQFQTLDASKNILIQRYNSTVDNLAHYNITGVINSETSAVLTITPPIIDGSNSQHSYIRFGANGSAANSNIFITYTDTQTVTREQWVDTGIQYGGSGLDEETAAKISELNNEGSDPSTIKLLSAPVLDFYNSDAYPDDDYTVTHLSKITYPCRADIPVPFLVKWNHNENAMRTTLVVDTKAIGTVNPYRMKIYDVTGFDNYPIYNLLPNTRYYYKVTHVMADGSLVEAKSGSFTTSSEPWRLLYIEGTQNARDLGGWTGLNGKKVKYGQIIRGASLSDTSGMNLIVTDKGRLALAELNVRAELNLGAVDTETSIAANCVYKKIYYTNYAIAITGADYRAQFKEVLEWIVDCLNNSKPIYMHCQGGCDRTGTLSFQLLGLLGVSESDLAKEYELSSFSDVGFGRLRTTTKAVDVYDYVGMVEALKEYSGDTITDKFYDFATTGCSISADTITAFRNLMLE